MEPNTIDEMIEICQAVRDGKTVQFYNLAHDEWIDRCSNDTSILDFVTITYRVKPEEDKEETLLTNRELSRWLAQGNGEWIDRNGYVRASYCYNRSTENDVPTEKIKIRKLDDAEWHKPTREYAFGEEDA